MDNQTTVIYRNYSSETVNEKLILKIKNYCKKKGIKFYLSNNIQIAMKLDLDGAYIPSFNKNIKHLAFSFKKNWKPAVNRQPMFPLEMTRRADSACPPTNSLIGFVRLLQRTRSKNK